MFESTVQVLAFLPKVIKLLSREGVVICDGLNYIKGFRWPPLATNIICQIIANHTMNEHQPQIRVVLRKQSREDDAVHFALRPQRPRLRDVEQGEGEQGGEVGPGGAGGACHEVRSG